MSFVKIRRGILEHLINGKLTLVEKGAYETIIELADHRTGVWIGCAKALSARCGAGDIDEREARRLLASLEHKGYIRRFRVQGSRRNYPILVNKYCVCRGSEEFLTNATATTDWRNPVTIRCSDNGSEHGSEHGSETGSERPPFQEVRTKNKEQRTVKKQAPAPLALPDWLPLDAWSSYLEMRIKIRKPMTNKAKELAIKTLESLNRDGHKPLDVLNQSIFNSWQGLFEIKPHSNGNGQRIMLTAQEQAGQRMKQAMKEWAEEEEAKEREANSIH